MSQMGHEETSRWLLCVANRYVAPTIASTIPAQQVPLPRNEVSLTSCRFIAREHQLF